MSALALVVLQAALLSGIGDLDQDGLSDAAEGELAESFRPKLVFDSTENALRSGEPVTLYQVRPVKTAPLTIRLTYLNLWAWDGGYGRRSWCKDSHVGDSQDVGVTVVSDDGGKSFRPVEVRNGAFTWPAKSGKMEWEGSHPVIYFSHGKHHQFFDTSYDGRPAPYTQWGCRETIDGKGPAFLSVLRANAGEPESHPSPPFAGDLAAFGFPGSHAWSTQPFLGPAASPPASFWKK